MTQALYGHEAILTYDGNLTTNIDVVLKNDLKIGSYENKIIYNNIDQSVLWMTDNFDKTAEGWSDMRTSVCGTSSDYFLGGPCIFSKQPVTKLYTNIPPHEMLLVSFNFHFIDDWEGETATLKLDSGVVW